MSEVLHERYEIERLLGSGGFGQTFLAQDLETRRQVVVKRLRMDRAADWKSIELFEREAATLQALDHVGIPTYLDWFELEHEGALTWCLVQEYAPGSTLHVARSRTQAQVVELADRLLDILMHLHERTPPVVHRDVKPQNILLGEEGQVWLVDFGSVKATWEDTVGGSTVTGTFGYMAPEQLRGRATPRADLYGLGATLVYALTSTEPDQLPTRRLKIDTHAVLEGADPDFLAWLDGLIAPIEEDRFVSAREAREALARCTESLGVVTPKDSPDAPKEAPVTEDPVRAIEPVRRLRHLQGPHRDLDALIARRGRILGMSGAVIAVAIAMIFSNMFVRVSGDLFAILGLMFVLPGGVLLGLWGLFRSQFLRHQRALERLTNWAMPVSGQGVMSLRLRDYVAGTSWTLCRRVRLAPQVVCAGLFTTFASLVFLYWFGATVGGLLFPWGMIALAMSMLIGGLAGLQARRRKLEVRADGTWFSALVGTFHARDVDAYEVTATRTKTAHEGYVLELWMKISGTRSCVFRTYETSPALVDGQMYLLRQLVREALGWESEQGVAPISEVILDFTEVEHTTPHEVHA